MLMTSRQMSRVLERIDAALGAPSARLPGVDDLALERIAKRRDAFHVLVGCIISLRTKDEVTDEAAPRLLARAPGPAALAALDPREIERLIYPACFYRTKARSLAGIARRLLVDHDGDVPATMDGLLALPGVGRKTANLVLTLGFGRPGICVDTHVHRISNRLGYVRTRAPDETEQVLRERLPRRWWIPINGLLVQFGRTVCTPLSPHCSTCPVRGPCRRVAVARSR
jgi:endonuclease-3